MKPITDQDRAIVAAATAIVAGGSATRTRGDIVREVATALADAQNKGRQEGAADARATVLNEHLSMLAGLQQAIAAQERTVRRALEDR